VKIDGVTVLSNGAFNVITNTGSTTGLNDATASTTTANANPNGGTTNFGMGPAGDGWHNSEIRFGNGNGGAGAVADAVDHWTATKGFGYSAAGAPGTATSGYDANNFVIPVDTGNGAFLRVASQANSVTKTGTGTLTLSGANTYLGGTTVSQG